MSTYTAPPDPRDLLNISSSSLSQATGTPGKTISFTERGEWDLIQNNTVVPDGTTFVAASGGSGDLFWRRRQNGRGDVRLLFGGSIQIDSSGDDASATHLKTWQELVYRLNSLTLDGVELDVALGAGTWSGSPLDIKLNNGAVFYATGTRSNIVLTGSSGTLTLTAWSNSSKQIAKAVNSALSANYPTQVIGQFASLTGHAGVSTFLGKDIGSKTAIGPGPYDVVNGAVFGGASASEAYQSYSLATILSNGAWPIRITSSGNGFAYFQDIEFSASGGGGSVVGGPFWGGYGCRFLGNDPFAPTLLAGTRSITPVQALNLAGCYLQNGIEARNAVVSLDGVFSDATIKAMEDGSIIINDQCIVAATTGFSCDPGGSIYVKGSGSTYGATTALSANSNGVYIAGFFFPFPTAVGVKHLLTKGGAWMRYASAANIGTANGGTGPTAAYQAGTATSTSLPLVGQVSSQDMAGIVAA